MLQGVWEQRADLTPALAAIEGSSWQLCIFCSILQTNAKGRLIMPLHVARVRWLLGLLCCVPQLVIPSR